MLPAAPVVTALKHQRVVRTCDVERERRSLAVPWLYARRSDRAFCNSPHPKKRSRSHANFREFFATRPRPLLACPWPPDRSPEYGLGVVLAGWETHSRQRLVI